LATRAARLARTPWFQLGHLGVAVKILGIQSSGIITQCDALLVADEFANLGGTVVDDCVYRHVIRCEAADVVPVEVRLAETARRRVRRDRAAARIRNLLFAHGDIAMSADAAAAHRARRVGV